MEKGLRVVKLVAENVKGLKAIEITPDENLQVIAGANGQGKTSVMDAIWLALAGGAASKGLAKPMRDGTDHAKSQLDLGEYIVTRKWTSNDKSTLTVTSKEGAKFSSPQKMLDELIGSLSFDPLAFANLDPKKQLETLLKLVNIDPSKIDSQKKTLFDNRTVINREVKTLRSKLDEYADISFGNIPDEEVKSSDVLEEMTKAQTALQTNNNKRQYLTELMGEYKVLKSETENDHMAITRLEQQLKAMKESYEEKQRVLIEIREKGTKVQEEVQSLVDPDMTVFNEKLAKIDEINQAVRRKKSIQQLADEFQQKSDHADDLTLKIKNLDEQKEKMMKEAKFPIEGLTFDENGILYNGVPLKQCSAAERLKVSMAMAMALNPRLKVIRILDGSLLDKKNMKVIEDLAKENDYQVWIEVVDESGQVGITIENGEIKA